jgi:hypothetical protein
LGVAVTVIAVTATGLIVALVVSGLSVATEITSFVLLIPLAVGAIRWAISDGARRSVVGDAIKVSARVSANPDELGDQPVLGGRNSLPSIPGITFRAPIPWSSLLIICYLLGFAAGGVPAILYPHRASQFIGWLMLFVGVAGVVEVVAGEFGSKARAIFDARPKLVVNQAGIYYRWNPRRDIACPWERIVRVRAGARDGHAEVGWPGEYLVLVLSGGEGGRRVALRNVVLCLLDNPGFPRDEIRGAIATFAPSLLDQSLYED